MDRAEAMSMLKDLVTKDLVEPSYIHILESEPKHFQIQIKCNYKRNEITEFAKTRGLTIKEDVEKKYLVIYRK